MKILYVGDLPPYDSGGAAIVGAHLVRGLGSRGHRVCALAATTSIKPSGDDGLELAGATVAIKRYSLPWIRSAKPPDARFRRHEADQIRNLLPRLIARERPEVLVAGQESVAWPIPPIAAAMGVPLIQLVHGAGHAFRRLLTYGTSDAGAADLIRLLQSADRVIVAATHLAEIVTGLVSIPVQAIPNPVDLSRFHPGPASQALRESLKITDGATVVTHVSCLDERKRPLDVVESAALTLATGSRLVYLVVGDGPCRKAMEEACRRHGIEDYFRFCGWAPHGRMAEHLRLSDIVVMPSAIEGLSLVYLEALATGCTVITTEIPAGHEAITHGENGLLFPCGNVESLAALTISAAEDRELRARLTRNALSTARAHGLPTFISRYETALEATVHEAHGRARGG